MSSGFSCVNKAGPFWGLTSGDVGWGLTESNISRGITEDDKGLAGQLWSILRRLCGQEPFTGLPLLTALVAVAQYDAINQRSPGGHHRERT